MKSISHSSNEDIHWFVETLKRASPVEAAFVASRIFLRSAEQFGAEDRFKHLSSRMRSEITDSLFVAGISGLARCSTKWTKTEALISFEALNRLSNRSYKANAATILSSIDASKSQAVTLLAEIVSVFAIHEEDASIKSQHDFFEQLANSLGQVLALIAENWVALRNEPSIVIERQREEFLRMSYNDIKNAAEYLHNPRAVPLWGSFQSFAISKLETLFLPRMRSDREMRFKIATERFISSVDLNRCFDEAVSVLHSWEAVSEINRDGTIRVVGFLGQMPLKSDLNLKQRSPREYSPVGQGESKDIAPESTFVEGRFVSESAILGAKDDHLGFSHAAKAVVDFVASDATILPLTISIEGEWGAGKSSFLNLIYENLNNRKFVTLSFHPWRYETVESMWAAFAISVADQLRNRGGIGFWRKQWMHITLGIARFKRRASVWTIFRSLIGFFCWFISASLVLAIVILIANDVDQSVANTLAELEEKWKSFVILPLVTAILPYLRKLLTFSGNPISDELRSYFRSSDYAQKATVLQRFHIEIREVLRYYSAGHKVALFIDDLDRCDPQVTTDVLRTLNLFLALDVADSATKGRGRPAIPLVTFIGMDRVKVAACLASSHKEILPFLSSTDERKEGDADLAARSLRFGYRYLEKFIHLGVALPRPGLAQMSSFLDSICPKSGVHSAEDTNRGGDGEVGGKEESMVSARNDDRAKDRTKSSGGTQLHNQLAIDSFDLENSDLERTEGRIEIEIRETDLVRTIAQLAVPVLGHNPRRVKQFVNLYRLRIRLAVELGLYLPRGDDVHSDQKGRLTLEQIGKLVVLEMSDPVAFSALRDDARVFIEDPDAFKAGAGPLHAPRSELVGKDRLLSFLWFSPLGLAEIESSRWSLEGVSLEGYFQIGLAPDSERLLAEEGNLQA